ncbi:MAG: hypothetical protein ACI9WS_002430 [Paraglaciecola psychrophila]|jgi:hypothetical protein
MFKPLLLVVFFGLLAGCASTNIDEYRTANEPLQLDLSEQMVVLGRRDAGHYETGVDFSNCVGDVMTSNSTLTVMPELEFIDAFYPWFEPRVAPKSLARLKRLLEEPLLSSKLEELNVRYMVWIDGETHTVDSSGSMGCSIGPGGAGCFGFSSWDDESTYEAIVWDLVTFKEKGRVSVDSVGTSYVVGVVIPVPFMARVQNEACIGMGKQVKAFFDSEVE